MNSIERPIQAELISFFKGYSIDVCAGILVAFSGGSDSLGLLYGLSGVVPAGKLAAAYVNHHLRPEQELSVELERNKANCVVLGVPMTVLDLGDGQVRQVSLQRGMGTEDAARVLRYQVLESERQRLGFGYIATAHTADDQLETLLMRLLQGSSLTSMRGISPMNGLVIRPVIALAREDLRSALRSADLAWVEDSTNGEDTYLRNRIRHDIVPAVLSVFPSALKTADLFTEKATLAIDFLRHEESSVESYISTDGDAVAVDLPSVAALPEYLKVVTVYRMWGRLQGDSTSQLSYEMASRISRMFSTADVNSKDEIICGNKTIVEKIGERLVWRKVSDVSLCEYVYEVDLSADSSIILPEEYVLVHTKNAEAMLSNLPLDLYIQDDKVFPPLVVRNWHDGDVITLESGTVLVSKLINQWKLPTGVAGKIPVLEDCNGLVAVLGKSWGGKDRLAKRFKVSPLAPIGLSHYSVMKRN